MANGLLDGLELEGQAGTESKRTNSLLEGLELEQAAPGRTIAGTIGDVVNTGLKSAIAVPELAVGLADLVTGGKAGKLVKNLGVDFADAKKASDSLLQSDAQAAAQKRVDGAEGFMGTVKEAVSNPSVIATTIGESLGSIGAGGVIGRGVAAALPRLAKFAAPIGEGAASAGSSAEGIRQKTADGELTMGQSALAAGSGLAVGLLGFGGGKLAKRLGIDDIDNFAAGVAAAPAAAKKGLLTRVIGGAVSEGIIEEMPQSAVEQIATNLALDKPWDEGVEKSMAMGALSGGVMGVGANLRGAQADQPQAPIQPIQPPAPAASPTGPTMAQQAARQAFTEVMGDEGVTERLQGERGTVALSLAQVAALDGEQGLLASIQHLSGGDAALGETLLAASQDKSLISQGRAALAQNTLRFIEINDAIRTESGLIEGAPAQAPAGQPVPAVNTPANQTTSPEQLEAVRSGLMTGMVVSLAEAETLDMNGLNPTVVTGPDGAQVLAISKDADTVRALVQRTNEVGLEQATTELFGMAQGKAVVQKLDERTGELKHEAVVSPEEAGGVDSPMGTSTHIRPVADVLAERMPAPVAAAEQKAPEQDQAPAPKFFKRTSSTGSTPEAFTAAEQTGASASLVERINQGYKLTGDEAINADSLAEVTPSKALRRMQAAIKTAFGTNLVFVHAPKGLVRNNGKVFNQFNGVASPTENTIFLNVEGNAALNTLGHELAHVLEKQHPDLYEQLEITVLSRMRHDAAKKLADSLRQAAENEGESSAGEIAQLRRELVAEGVGEMSDDPAFWGDLFSNIGEDGTKAKTLYQKVMDVIAAFQRALTSAGFITGIRDVATVKRAVAEAYKAWARDYEVTGGNQDNLTTEGKEMLAQFEKLADEPAPKEPVAPKAQKVVKATTPAPKLVEEQEAPVPEADEVFAREYKLGAERKERTVSSVAGLSAKEVSAITDDASKLGLGKKQITVLLDAARSTRKRYPARAGWAPIEAVGVTAKLDDDGVVKTDRAGVPQVDVKWASISYNFNVAPGATRAPAKHDQQLRRKVADQMLRLVDEIYTRASSGDERAKIIISHQTWYRNVAEILRREFGAQGDLFADLLGATSPNTPVDTNWAFSVDLLRRFSRGEFDSEMKAFIAHTDAGGRPSAFTGEKIRQASGKLYGMNSGNAMVALANLWRNIEPGQLPKARNFALNLIGQSNMATIDVWAARMLRRAADSVRGMNLPRIPPVAEVGVTGRWNASATGVAGQFGFGAEVFQTVSDDLAKRGIDLSPPDLQALAWFAEKELWTRENWTSVQGEGGSFEENIDKAPTNRYVMGFSIQQGERAPLDGDVSVAQARLLSTLRGDDSVLSARVLPTFGLFMGKPEEAFDIEWTVQRGMHSPALLMAEASKLAKEHPQMALFVSRALRPDENSTNARPGAEVYFRAGTKMEEVQKVMDAFVARGLDGFTLAVDPRAKSSTRPGAEFIGVRIQYIPEFDESATPENVEQLMLDRRDQLDDAVRSLRSDKAVAFSAVYNYDTEVVSGEAYNDYIDRAASGANRPAGSPAWEERSVRARLEGAASRVHSDAGQNGGGGVQDAVAPLPEAFSRAAESAVPVSSDGGERSGGVARGTEPAAPGRIDLVGTHFSTAARTTLDGRFNGQGLKGAEAQRLALSNDRRIKERVYVYIDEGQGIRPEAGVGGRAHRVDAKNLYDAGADALGLNRAADANQRETNILNAGFDGYYVPKVFNNQGVAVILGDASRGLKATPLGTGVTSAGVNTGTINSAKPTSRKEGDELVRKPVGNEMLELVRAKAALQAAAPSYRMEYGTARVKQTESDAANQVLQAAGSEFAFSRAGLLAPNGKPSKLNEQQHAQVRTKEFKAWFGDWEMYAKMQGTVFNDDKRMVSKAVDMETGEPMVLYHGTDKAGFSEFIEPGGGERGDLGIFLTDNRGMAKTYVKKRRESTITAYNIGEDADEFSGVYEVFANIRNPNEEYFGGANWDGEFYGDYFEVYDADGETAYNEAGDEFMTQSEAQDLADSIGGTFEPASPRPFSTDSVVKEAHRGKNDGSIMRDVSDDGGGSGLYSGEPATVVVALKPNQIKSAAFNSGEFGKSEDIRFSRNPMKTMTVAEEIAFTATGKPNYTLGDALVRGQWASAYMLAKDPAERKDLLSQLGDAVINAFADSRIKVQRWVQSLPIPALMGQRLEGDLRRSDTLRSAMEGDVKSQFTEPMMAAITRAAKATGRSSDDVKGLAGKWMSAVYSPEASALLIRKDRTALLEAQATGDASKIAAAQQDLQDRILSVNGAVGDVKTRGVGGGRNNAEAALVQAQVEALVPVALLQEIATPIYKMLDWKLQEDLKSGKVTQTAVNSWLNSPRYIPLTGDPRADRESTDVFSSGGQVNQDKDHAMNGRSDSVADDGIDAAFTATIKSINFSAMQDFKRSLNETYEHAKANNIDIGLTREAVTGIMRTGDDVIIYRDTQTRANGTEFTSAHAFKFKDQRIIEALKKDNVEHVAGLLKVFSSPTRWYARAVTQFMPFFAPINLVRDIWERSEVLRTKKLYAADGSLIDVKKAARASIADVINRDLWKASMGKAFRRGGRTAIRDELEEMIRHGGSSTTGDYLDRSAGDLESSIRGDASKLGHFNNSIMHKIEAYNDTFEMIPSLAIYRALKAQGMDARSASAAVLDLMNFRKKGSIMPNIKALYVFSQPAATSGYNLARYLSTRTGQVRFASQALIGVALYAFLRGVWGDDDDEEMGNKLDNLSNFTVERTIPIPVGGYVVKVPVGFGPPQLAWMTAGVVSRYASGRYSAGDALGEMSKGWVKSFAAIAPSDMEVSKRPVDFLIQTLTPTVVKPLFNIYADQTAFGSPLTPAFKNPDKLKADQARRTTPGVYTDIAKEVQAITGVDMYPDHLKAMVDGYLVGPLREIINLTVEQEAKKARGEPMRVPLVASLIDTVNDRAVLNSVYSRVRNDMDSTHRELMTLQADRDPDGKITPEMLQMERSYQRFLAEEKLLGVQRAALKKQVNLDDETRSERTIAIEVRADASHRRLLVQHFQAIKP